MSVYLLIGAQWGDEGKAKMIDYLAKEVDIIVRYQGGANAGHTVFVGGESYIFHLIPSGILYPDKVCILGGGMVIDLEVFFQEIEELERRNVPSPRERILVAENAHIILPWHKEADQKREAILERPIGTTKRGIGMGYADKVLRQGIRVKDIFSDSFYKERLPYIVKWKNQEREHIYHLPPISLKEVEEYLRSYKEKLRPFVISLVYYINDALKGGKRILLEGAQGTLLDVDFGTYPYVTSSHPTVGGALIGSGINWQYIREVIGVMKCYATRVGEGPFPTEEKGEIGEILQERGKEFGATTGRKRRCGWLDLEAVRYASLVNGFTSLAITKLDVLSSFSTIKVGVGYRYLGERYNYFPSGDWEKVEVEYEELPGWGSLEGITDYESLPEEVKLFIEKVENHTGVPVRWVSIGPSREATIEIP